jgi:hypothetical protein
VRLSSVGTAAHFSEPTAFLSHEGTNPQPSYPVHHASNVKQSSCPAPYYTQIPHDVSSLAAGATVPPNVMHLRSKGSVPRFRPRMRASPGLDLIMRCKEFRLALRHWMAQSVLCGVVLMLICRGGLSFCQLSRVCLLSQCQLYALNIPACSRTLECRRHWSQEIHTLCLHPAYMLYGMT